MKAFVTVTPRKSAIDSNIIDSTSTIVLPTENNFGAKINNSTVISSPPTQQQQQGEGEGEGGDGINNVEEQGTNTHTHVRTV